MGKSETEVEHGTHRNGDNHGSSGRSDNQGTLRETENPDKGIDIAAAGGPGRETLKGRRGDLIFSLGCSVRYCAKRAHFYAVCSDWTTLVSLIGGTAVFADIVGTAPLAATVGAILIVTSSLCGLTFKWQEKARFWSIQRTKYGKLEERFTRLGKRMTEEELNHLSADMVALEADEKEGSTLNILHTICYNEECNARNANDYKIEIRAHQRLCAYVLDLPPVVWR